MVVLVGPGIVGIVLSISVHTLVKYWYLFGIVKAGIRASLVKGTFHPCAVVTDNRKDIMIDCHSE